MTAWLIIGLVLAALAAALHLAFFVLESVLFRLPLGRRVFGVRPENDSAPLRLFAVNQGVYNLGLALVVLVGIVLALSRDSWGTGFVIIITGCSLMVLAGIALAATAPKRTLPIALAQGGLPLLAIAALVVNG